MQRKTEEEEHRAVIEEGYWYLEPVSMHERVIKVRKGMLGSNGKPLTQRDFAKYIGYPINKYVEAEKTDRLSRLNRRSEESGVEFVLLEKLNMFCHANPHWLFNDNREADCADYDMNDELVKRGDAPCVFTTPDIIL